MLLGCRCVHDNTLSTSIGIRLAAVTVSSKKQTQTVNQVCSSINQQGFRSAIVKGRYRKGPRDTCRTVCTIALHHKTNTNPSPDPNRYRRRCPDPNARIQKFIHYMAIAAFAIAGCHPSKSRVKQTVMVTCITSITV